MVILYHKYIFWSIYIPQFIYGLKSVAFLREKGNDNLEEVLEIYLDEKKVKQLAEKIREKAENIMYLG